MAALFAVAAPFMGCGTRYASIYPASGRVTYKDGQPVTGGIIEFEAVNNSDNKIRPNARASIEQDGSFRLTTRVFGDGAVEGDHQVIVIAPLEGISIEGQRRAAKPTIPGKYRDYRTSELRATVVAGDNDFTFTIDRK